MYGLSGKAMGNAWDLRTVNIRDFAKDKHKTVDDTPFGGGPGMIMRPDIVHEAMLAAVSYYDKLPAIIYVSPKGVVFSQKIAQSIVDRHENGLIILCGRYEGIDERVIEFWKENYNMHEMSIGDYILFGGEIPALAIMDCCVRLCPNVVHNPNSVIEESFFMDYLEHPQYTRPREWQGRSVPDVLCSGNHQQIASWRREASLRVTQERRPDLLLKKIGEKNESNRTN